MNFRSILIAASMLVTALPAFAAQKVEGSAVSLTRVFPSMTLIYVVPGVTDDGAAAETGVASSFHCVNTDTVTRQVRFTLRNSGGSLVSTNTYDLTAQEDFTASTHYTVVFSENVALAPGSALSEGTAYIFATSANVFCSAAIVAAAQATPFGFDIHVVRRNAAPGTQE